MIQISRHTVVPVCCVLYISAINVLSVKIRSNLLDGQWLKKTGITQGCGNALIGQILWDWMNII